MFVSGRMKNLLMEMETASISGTECKNTKHG